MTERESIDTSDTRSKPEVPDPISTEQATTVGCKKINTDLSVTICRLFADHLSIEVPDEHSDLIESGLLDSLAMVDLLVQLEREFGFTVVMDELDVEDFRCVKRIADYVARCRE